MNEAIIMPRSLSPTDRDVNDPPDDLLWLSLEIAQVPCSPLYGRHVSPDRELAAVLSE